MIDPKNNAINMIIIDIIIIERIPIIKGEKNNKKKA